MVYGSILPFTERSNEDTHLLSSTSHSKKVNKTFKLASKGRQIIALSLCVCAIIVILTSRDYTKRSSALQKVSENSRSSRYNLNESLYHTLFEDFKAKYGREYESDDEEQARFMAFRSNFNKISELKTKNPLADFAINEYGDFTENDLSSRKMTNEYSEYSRILSALPSEIVSSALEASSRNDISLLQRKFTGPEIRRSQFDWISEDDCAACKRYPHLKEYNLMNMPDEWDWRNEFKTPVLDQGFCGSCWSFSTAGDIEGSHFLDTGNVITLSKQQLIACDQKKGACEGCMGGFPFAAMQYVSRIGGLVSESTYPYVQMCVRNCPKDAHSTPTCDKSLLSSNLKSKHVAHIGGWQMVALGEYFEDLLAVALVKNGPVSIAVNSYAMEFYRGGIVESTVDCDPDLLDHAVLLVGFGVENGVRYWIIKNSWGSSWGEDGYMRVVRGVNFCGLSNFAVTSVVKEP